ncbi:HEAT repeat domain-containing protein [Telmatocola sphagniphila]|uniref:HEAT repeat domain-containing protein n=1 Tax=Telmatocola sphagniphila TaxID=1123043 RepID=A0A8E6EXK2_9BACT|nr:HEAT repeat domain-containing protein [Telmatocola sphagniphila]QVL31361.1 HEAT repeat domain-containing protein [Telmatocola sphagniphila]
MRHRIYFLLFVGLFGCIGCGSEKSTNELIADLSKGGEKERFVAVRSLTSRTGEVEKVLPALIAALKDKEDDIRLSAAIGLGVLGEQAKEAIPALQAALHDQDARIRRAAGVAINRIDPSQAKLSTAKKPGRSKS